MKITKRGEYALKIMIALANGHALNRPLTLREISVQEKLPLKFLEQIMILLRHASLVDSSKGSRGGYNLAQSANEITLGEIIRAAEGPLSPIGTGKLMNERLRSKDRHAGLYSVLLDVRNAISEILDKKTLADVQARSLELALSERSESMYYI